MTRVATSDFCENRSIITWIKYCIWWLEGRLDAIGWIYVPLKDEEAEKLSWLDDTVKNF